MVSDDPYAWPEIGDGTFARLEADLDAALEEIVRLQRVIVNKDAEWDRWWPLLMDNIDALADQRDAAEAEVRATGEALDEALGHLDLARDQIERERRHHEYLTGRVSALKAENERLKRRRGAW